MDTSTKYQVEWGVYCENFVMIGLTAESGDHFKNRASIPLAPYISYMDSALNFHLCFSQWSLLSGSLKLKNGLSGVTVCPTSSSNWYMDVDPTCGMFLSFIWHLLRCDMRHFLNIF
jgi:hypothetical protein